MNIAVLEVPKFRRDRIITMSIKKYQEDLEDARLLAIAEERMKYFAPDTLVTFEDVLQEDGLTKDDLKDWEDIDIE